MLQLFRSLVVFGSLFWASSLGHAVAPPKETKGLHELAVDRGLLYFGTGTHNQDVRSEPRYYKQLNNTHDFGQVVPAWSQKQDVTNPSRGRFDFALADQVVNRALANGQLLRCHALIWHLSTPVWLVNGGFNNETLISIMEEYITKVVSHYKGKCYAWDVVNEAVIEDGSWRPSVFYDTIGPAFVPIAFAAAAKADPDAKLYYNDFAIEFPSPKATATENIVKLVQQYGVRIDGVGLQGHYELSGMPPDAHFELGSMPSYDEQVAVMKAYAALDVEVALTEVDVSVLLPGNATIIEKQAEVYYNATAACLMVKECVGITIWDWSDKHTWVPDVFPDMGLGLPWDAQYKKKPAYYAIQKALKAFWPTS